MTKTLELDEVGKRVRQAWSKLVQQLPTARQGLLAEPLFPFSDKCLFVGFDVETKCPILLLKAEKKTLERLPVDLQAEWFGVYAKSYEDDRTHITNCIIELRDEDSYSMFTLFVTYVAKHVLDLILQSQYFRGNKDSQRVAEFRRRVKCWWRENRGEEKVMSIPKQRGLQAELWFLRQYAIPRLGPEMAIRSWVGPSGSDHDFQFPACGVEVKAVVVDEEAEIRISNEYQLDSCRRRTEAYQEERLRLFLYCVFLREQEGSSSAVEEGETLHDVIESLRDDLKASCETALGSFEIMLRKAGYRKKDEETYKRFCRAVVAEPPHPCLYEVADMQDQVFPRIIRSNLMGSDVKLPSSIHRVKYRLKLSGIREFRRKEDILLQCIEG